VSEEVEEEEKVELWTELCLTGSLIDYYFRQARIALTRPLNPIGTWITTALPSPWYLVVVNNHPGKLLVNVAHR
jgi:hypothetical protein